MQGNLLDDTELIGVLAVTKSTAAQVNQKLQGASETRRRISEACEEYRPVAKRAQILYFLILQFSVVNCMYQTSLTQFNHLYELAIDTAERAVVASKRIENITEHLTYEIFLYFQRGLFERHKIVFALMLAFAVLTSSGKVKPAEVKAFLKGGGALTTGSTKKKVKEWIPDAVWLNITVMSETDAFRDLPDAIARADVAWRHWYDAEAPERAPVPAIEDHLSKFQRMCVVRAWREDRTLVAAADCIADALGQRYVESVPLSMEKTWVESSPKVPIICLLSPGSDPTKLIEDLAKRKKVKTLGVSMGQGQEIIARNYLAAATTDGQWLLLQNTHLGLAYLSELEGALHKLDTVHESFRLWVTAEPHPAFPIGLLQMGIKVTNEAPVGMKAGLRASYQWITQDMLDAVNRSEWRQLLYLETFLHSVVQERRKFGPIGWNVPYEFNLSDLSACVQFLQNHMLEMDAKRAPAPGWETIRYMVSVVQYGGRITDEYDKLLMDTLAEKYFQPSNLLPNFAIYKDPKEGSAYTVPQGSEIDVYRKAIEDMPNQDSPELFGMHANVDLTFRKLQVQAAIQVILDTQPQGASASGASSVEETVDALCEELLAKAPPLFGREDVREKLRKLPGGPTQPLTVHLRQEIDRLNIIITLTTTTLKNVRLAIAGTIALSGKLADSLDALYNGRIPKDWLAKSWEAGSLGSWFAGLLQRHDQLLRWLSTGRPKAYWLTGFFNPQGFLTAVRQEVNRRHAADKWALDDVVLTSEVMHPAKDVDGIAGPPNEGVFVYGLYLDGCAWSNKENKLVDSEPKKLYSALPILHVTGVQEKDKKKTGTFEAPVYRTKKRTGLNYITSFSLKTDETPSKWIMRGVALLCTIE
ncbi:Dynein gamma chain, flagellar outer arm [Coccomyxa viridis]|uniref:Dynein gamma chain, flagellar outer arm n=1 Tax=Coccomyxa viridis TaxID=1274662 RepID=A0AAV1HY11_9CHLO|nr:Dynein gamma chain, flagellar outer arm [Coccomyxa viridis]